MLEVTDQTFDTTVLKSPIPVVVDFWADWCMPCRVMLPVIEEYARDFQGRVKVVKLDIEANPNIANRFAIHSIPSLLFFKKGRLEDQIIGTCSKSQIIQMTEELFRKT